MAKRQFNEDVQADKYEPLYDKMVTKKVSAVDDAARKCLRFKNRYKKVEKATGIPWDFIAVLHLRESNNNFKGVLHNGDQIIGTGRKTYRVPKGRGPFNTWEAAAVDALDIKGWVKDGSKWTTGLKLARGEIFNGLGYFWKGKRSPYVWGGTNLQQPGKYVADHKWSSTHMDSQLGIAPVLKRIGELDRVKTVPGGKLSGWIRTARRAYEGVVAAVGAWLSQFYENLTIENVADYATDPKVLGVFVGGFLFWVGLKALDLKVLKAYKEGNYYTNDELDMEAE
jgi:lysozyme family protein